MRHVSHGVLVALIGLTVVIPSVATGEGEQIPRRSLIEAALDEPTQLVLEDITLGDAIDRIAEASGVRIYAPPEVLAYAPHGAATQVQRLEISNMTLRQGLTELFAPLGMMVTVEDSFVSIEPKPAIRCLGRPVTWPELDTLTWLSALQPGLDGEALQALRERLQFDVGVQDGWAVLSEEIQAVGAGQGDEVLSLACARLGWAWCLSDKHIRISTAVDQVQRQLQQHISLRLNYKPLIEVLGAVADATGVPIRVAPGTLATLPSQVRQNFSLNVRHKSAEQVLETVAAYTGLGYFVEADGVQFFPPGQDNEMTRPAAEETAAAQPHRDPYVGKVTIQLDDGRSMEWFVRRSELPPDLRERREQDLEAAFESLRQQMDDPANP